MKKSLDVVLTGGNIITFDDAQPSAEALGVRGGKVVVLGDSQTVEGLMGHETAVVRLRGATVLPGFCDTHMHLQLVARYLAMVHPAGSQTIAEVLGRVKAVAENAPPGEWIRTLAHDERWHESRLAERRLPTKQEIDEVVHTHPVCLYRRLDAAVLNSAAIERAASWLASLPSEDWSEEEGALRGFTSVRFFNDWLNGNSGLSSDREIELLRSASQRLFAMGITSIVDPGLPHMPPGGFENSWALYGKAKKRGALQQRVWLMNQLNFRDAFDVQMRSVTETDVRPFTGDDYLRTWAIKAFVDGEFKGAWMRAEDDVGTDPIVRYTGSELEQLIGLCMERGWPVCFHVMGGRAIQAVIDAVEILSQKGVPVSPNLVSLAHVFLAKEEDLSRAAKLGIAISVQPVLAYGFAREMRSAWGQELIDRCLPIASMLKAGVTVAGGSDILPCDPLRGAWAAVTRRQWDGQTFGCDQAVGKEEALRLWTRGAGEYLGDRRVGRLETGSFADYVIWPQNPLEMQVDEWLELQPIAVAVGGTIVWSTGELPVTRMDR